MLSNSPNTSTENDMRIVVTIPFEYGDAKVTNKSCEMLNLGPASGIGPP